MKDGTGKRECLTYTSETQVHKTSNILDMREGPAALGSPEADDVEEVEEHQTVITTLPTEVNPLESSNHFHVQLFDGQVIHITSTPLEETGGGVKKECEGGVKQDGGECVVNGEVDSGGGTVTLLTSNGKTYILPQPLTSTQDGSYLIPDEVLNTEEVLHGSNVLHEEQMLTISPPPPQSTMTFNSSVANHPDALAIATSEVFSEDYVSVPLQTQGPLAEQSKTFKFKTVETEKPQEIRNNMYTHSRSDSQRRSLLIPDASIITINASDTAGTDQWVEKTACFTSKKLVKENIDTETISSEENVNCTSPHSKVKKVKECTDDVRQIQLDPTSYSVYSKWVNLGNNVSSKLYAIASSPRAELKGMGQVKVGDTIGKKEEADERSMQQQVNSDHTEEGSSNLEMQDKPKLRRSSRIRKVKKVPNDEESELTEEAATWKRRKGMKGEAPSALWECGSCDAMFRTKVGRDRHVKEGHAFTCYVCGWEGHSKTKYEVHISTVHCNQQARCLACRKDFPGYEAYKQHMKEMHSTSTATSTSTSTCSVATTPSSLSTTSCVGAAVAVKMEVESNVRLEEQVKKEDQRILEETNNPSNTDFKDFNSHGERSCPYCSKTFTRRSRFLRHLNYHLGNRTFMCKICSKCFVEKSGLDAHLLTHCPINKECSQCGKVFKTERTMTRHLRTHLNVTYTCDFCNKQFRHEESLRVHKSVHKEGGSGNVCKVCEKDCKTPHYLQLHMSTKHEAAKFTCHQCNRSFKWKQSYRKHMAIHHEDAYLKFQCNLCPRHFMTSSELRLHQVVHSSEKKHLCDICGKAFKHEYTRDKHTKTVHREDREHMCPQCGTLFKAKAYLDQHLAHVHTTKERVVCKYCGNDFKTEANLRSHIKIVHKPRNPKYTCKTCHKTFLAPKDLLRHSKVHTGVKDYTCPKCHRCFSRKDNMVAHLRTHTSAQDCPDAALESEAVITDAVISQGSHQVAGSQEMPHILDLPSSHTSNLSSVSSSNIILSSVPTTSGNIVLSEVNPANSIVLSGESSSETTVLGTPSSSSSSSSSSSCITTVTETPVTAHRVSISSLPVPSMAGVSNMPPSSTGSIIFSTGPLSSFNNVCVSSSSTCRSVSNGTLSNTLAYSTSNSMSSSTTSSSCTSLSTINPPASSPIINLSPSSPLAACGTPQNHQAYSFHPQLVVSSSDQVSNISSLLTASPVPSSVLSLPPSHSTSAPVLMPQNSRAQMVCSTLQGEQVVLTTEPLTPISKVSIHDGSTPQYTQLDPLSASVCSTPSTSMSVTINPLSPSVSSGARSLNATLGADEPLSADSTPHTPSVDVPDSVESNIILPTSSILQEAALILPEKSGLYTIVGGGGGKITPLESLTLHPVPPPSSHSD